MKTRSSSNKEQITIKSNTLQLNNDKQQCTKADLTILPPDAMELITTYLPNFDAFTNSKKFILFLSMHYLPLRDLSAMSRVSKSCRNSITTNMVVTAAYNKVGDRFNTRKSMDELYRLMSSNSMHIPSPLRILQISTGNKCEICNSRHNTMASWSFGMFACWQCVSERKNCLSKAWNTSWVRYGRNKDKYDVAINHPRNAISKLYGKKYYIMEDIRVVRGEKVGPIVCWKDIDAIAEYMGNSKSSQYIQKMDEYLEDVIDAPSVAEYNEFNKAYVKAKADVERKAEQAENEKAERRRIREEKKRKREAEQQAKDERKRRREEAAAAKRGEEAPAPPNPEQQQKNDSTATTSVAVGNQPSEQSSNTEQQEEKDNSAAVTNVVVGSQICAGCNKSKSCDSYSQSQLRNRKRFARCKDCVAANLQAKGVCSDCSTSKESGCFRKEMYKETNPRCKDCCKKKS